MSDGRIMVGQGIYAPEDAFEAMRAEKEKEEQKRGEQQIIEEEELSNHLSHGWRFVAVLGNGKCVIEKG